MKVEVDNCASVPGRVGGSDPSNLGEPRGRRLAALSLATLGVVYGDIGTSPL